MKNWLHQEIFRRLADQASCLLGDYEHALVVTVDGFKPDVSALAKRSTTISYAQLGKQTPQPVYDLVFVHVLPNDLEQQLLIWQQLACLVQDGAMLFFSAWSVDTFCEWREWIGVEFQDMHNIGDGLAQAGWTDAVMSSQHMQVTYDYAEALQHDAAIVQVQLDQVEVPATATYEMAFGHAVFSRTAMQRRLGEYEVDASSIPVGRQH
jgi:hypothetical protein